MKLIAHRGNIYGPNATLENKPQYILEAIKLGYDCEIDVWYINNNFFLGHDEPTYNIEFGFLLSIASKIWVHCKNFEAFDKLIQVKEFNIFWHDTDKYTLTSHQYIWAYPNMQTTERCIILMPEWNNFIFGKGYGICSDYVDKIKNMIEYSK
jgi:hypothetical protein